MYTTTGINCCVHAVVQYISSTLTCFGRIQAHHQEVQKYVYNKCYQLLYTCGCSVYFINLYMFRAYLGPSSGGTKVCIQQLVSIVVYMRLFSIFHQPLHVSGVSRPIIRRYKSMYTTIGINCCIHAVVQYISSTSTCFGRIQAHHQEIQKYVYNNWYQLLYTYVGTS